MFTAHVSYPFENDPVYVQRCRCLEKAGFPFTQPEFHVEIAPALLQAADISESDTGTFFHVSPFTTADYKELSPEQLAELIGALAKKFPQRRWVFSCAPTEREQKKMESLLPLLPIKPWHVFAGNLSLVQVAAVIQHGALHLCGDTGTLHLALMTGTPSVSWFWPNPSRHVWIPSGNRHRTIVGRSESSKQFLCEIENDDLSRAVHAVLDGEGKD